MVLTDIQAVLSIHAVIAGFLGCYYWAAVVWCRMPKNVAIGFLMGSFTLIELLLIPVFAATVGWHDEKKKCIAWSLTIFYAQFVAIRIFCRNVSYVARNAHHIGSIPLYVWSISQFFTEEMGDRLSAVMLSLSLAMIFQSFEGSWSPPRKGMGVSKGGFAESVLHWLLLGMEVCIFVQKHHPFLYLFSNQIGKLFPATESDSEPTCSATEEKEKDKQE